VAQHFEETSDIMEDERARYEVWIYSICGSIVVGKLIVEISYYLSRVFSI
jgi:hypothetical protein